MSHRLTSAIKKDDKDVPIVKVKPGVFALREWEGKKGKQGARPRRRPRPPRQGPRRDATARTTGVEVNALEIEAALRGGEARPASKADEDEGRGRRGAQPTPVSGEEALRGGPRRERRRVLRRRGGRRPAHPGRAAGAAGARRGAASSRARVDAAAGAAAVAGVAVAAGRARGRGASAPGGPRRERRVAAAARRARFSRTPIVSIEGDVQPRLEASVERDGEPAGPPSRPVVRDRQQIMAGGQPTGIDIPLGEGDELAGRELADAACASCSRRSTATPGPVPIRTVAEALMRRGRLQGDPRWRRPRRAPRCAPTTCGAAASGQRPRFRFANGARVALTDWSLGGELPRLEQDVVAAVERYREASRRAMLRRLQELPGHALVELLLVALERAGHDEPQGRAARGLARRRGALLGGPQDGRRRHPDGHRRPQGRPRDRPRARDRPARRAAPLRAGQRRLAGDHRASASRARARKRPPRARRRSRSTTASPCASCSRTWTSAWSRRASPSPSRTSSCSRRCGAERWRSWLRAPSASRSCCCSCGPTRARPSRSPSPRCETASWRSRAAACRRASSRTCGTSLSRPRIKSATVRIVRAKDHARVEVAGDVPEQQIAAAAQRGRHRCPLAQLVKATRR